jgi:hypothetical protein
MNVRAGNAAIVSAEFRGLFDSACRYRDAREIAGNPRTFSMLSEQEAAEEDRTLQEFVAAYRRFHKERGLTI